MEIITLKYNAVKQALVTLDIAIKRVASIDCATDDYLIIRDGLIQRFEYSIDSFWKFLKIYLEEVQKISIESSSPRSILKLSLSSNLINSKEYGVLLKCVSDRNLTSHTYNEEVAEKIQLQIPLYYQIMNDIIDNLKIS